MIPVNPGTLAMLVPEIQNVLDGHTADRSARFGPPIHIPGSTIRQCFDRMIAAVIEEVSKHRDPTIHLRSAVISALATHISLLTFRPLEAIHTIAEQIPEFVQDFLKRLDLRQPHFTTARAVLEATLGAVEQSSAAFKAHMASAPPRRHLWTSDDDRYTLQEATDPRHLVQDSDVLGHCLGNAFNYPALNARGIAPYTAQSLDSLTYWMRIKRGESRILSLLDRGMPICSMTLCPAEGLITHIEKAHVQLRGKLFGLEPFMPALRRALFAVKDTLPLYDLVLPGLYPTNRALVSPDNTPVPIHQALHADILTGFAKVPRGIPDNLLHKLYATSLVTLDLSELPPQRLAEMPDTVLANVCIRYGRITLPRLRHARTIFGDIVTSFDAPRLETVLNLHLTSAHTVVTPMLSGTVLSLSLRRAKEFSAAIERAHMIDLRDAVIIELPKLRYVGTTLNACEATRVSLPALKRTGHLEAPKVENLDLRKLEYACSITATSAKTVQAPKLRPYTDLSIGEHTALHAPKVEPCRVSRHDAADLYGRWVTSLDPSYERGVLAPAVHGSPDTASRRGRRSGPTTA